MRKMREDSTWKRLTPEQRETLEGWLFDENLVYASVVERVREEFGLQTTVASVGRYYRSRARLRQVLELLEAQLAANALNVPGEAGPDARRPVWAEPAAGGAGETGAAGRRNLNPEVRVRSPMFAYVRLCSPMFA